MNLQLTSGQAEAFLLMQKFLQDENRNSFIINGAAGTGKTTILQRLKDELPDDVVVGAPTNKAVGVLRKKGFVTATTLDRILNRSVYNPLKRPPNPAEIQHYTENEMLIPAEVVVENYDKIPIDSTSTIIALDESSMTNEEEFNRLLSMYKKVIFVGDNFQLPPVEGVKWFQDAEPDFTLTEIVRTSSESEIITLADMLRRCRPEWKKHHWKHDIAIISKTDRSACRQAFLQADQVLAFKNKTCDETNFIIRDDKVRNIMDQRDSYQPQKGDRLLAWANQKDANVFKSEIYTVIKSFPLVKGCYPVILDNTKEDKYFKMSRANLIEQKTDIVVENMDRFSFAWCITGHKSQGSEWDNVVVLAHDYYRGHEGYWNWLYTCCTRAKKHLTIIV